MFGLSPHGAIAISPLRPKSMQIVRLSIGGSPVLGAPWIGQLFAVSCAGPWLHPLQAGPRVTLPPSTTSPPKLPFWRTVGACYATVFGNFGQLLRISWLWLLIMLPVYAAAEWLDARSQGDQIGDLLLSMLSSVLEVPALASIAVAWHRLVLRQERVQGAVYLRLDRVVWWYAMILLAFIVVTVGPFLAGVAAVLPEGSPDTPLLLVPIFAGIGVGLGIGVFVLPRLSLVLPAGALGERLTLGEAVARNPRQYLAPCLRQHALQPSSADPCRRPAMARSKAATLARIDHRQNRVLAGLCADRHDRGYAAVAGVPAFRRAARGRRRAGGLIPAAGRACSARSIARSEEGFHGSRHQGQEGHRLRGLEGPGQGMRDGAGPRGRRRDHLRARSRRPQRHGQGACRLRREGDAGRLRRDDGGGPQGAAASLSRAPTS